MGDLDLVVDDDAIPMECARCGKFFAWHLDEELTSTCPTCADADERDDA